MQKLTNLNWIQSYLANRTQIVAVGGDHEQSCSLPVISGVPQGSVLRPLLFLIQVIYINDVSAHVTSSSKLALFADVQMTWHYRCISSPTDYTTLQTDITAISTWVSKQLPVTQLPVTSSWKILIWQSWARLRCSVQHIQVEVGTDTSSLCSSNFLGLF